MLGNFWQSNLVFINIKVHESPHNNAVDEAESNKALQIVNEDAKDKGTHDRPSSSKLQHIVDIMDRQKEQETVNCSEEQLEREYNAVVSGLLRVLLYFEEVDAKKFKDELARGCKDHGDKANVNSNLNWHPPEFLLMDRLLTLVVFIQTHGIPFVSWCQVRAILPCV